MHRHGYKGRKFGRETDQRRALIKSLADSLVLRESIQTTLPKAKELSSYIEKLITKAKKGDLHNRRLIISKLATIEAAHKLVDEIAPKLTTRNSGYVRVEKTTTRRGDGTQMARISFVDDLSKAEKPAVESSKQKVASNPAARKTSKPTAKKVSGEKK
jgi:large subunit ribosomal protein L17